MYSVATDQSVLTMSENLEAVRQTRERTVARVRAGKNERGARLGALVFVEVRLERRVWACYDVAFSIEVKGVLLLPNIHEFPLARSLS